MDLPQYLKEPLLNKPINNSIYVVSGDRILLFSVYNMNMFTTKNTFRLKLINCLMLSYDCFDIALKKN